MRNGLTLRVLGGLFIALTSGGGVTAHAQWIRHLPQNRGVIIFVHGVMGDERGTWTSTSGKAYWPEMLTHDPDFDGQNIYVYHYQSPRVGQAFSIDQLADNMRLILATDGVLREDNLTFVSHSMGGIVTRAFILRYRNDVVRKVRLLYFFVTPTTGSSYARIADLISRNPQFAQMLPIQQGADRYLAGLESDWLAAKLGLPSYCAYETQAFVRSDYC
jgi:pimeloyl-ACP methyl ester carboxylesterase